MELLIVLTVNFTKNFEYHIEISDIRHKADYKINELALNIKTYLEQNILNESFKTFINDYFNLFLECVDNKEKFAKLKVEVEILNKYLIIGKKK